jgi:hypothetical protein
MSVRSSLNPGIFFATITAEQHAHAVIRSIGYEKETYGHWIHGVQNNLYNFKPTAAFITWFNRRRVIAFTKKMAAAKAKPVDKIE